MHGVEGVPRGVDGWLAILWLDFQGGWMGRMAFGYIVHRVLGYGDEEGCRML